MSDPTAAPSWFRACLQSRRLRLLAGWGLLLFTQLALWRLVFAVRFHPSNGTWPLADLFHAVQIGLRFDLRLALLLLLPPALLFCLPTARGPLHRAGWRFLLLAWMALAQLVVHVLAVTDLGHYAYLGQRLNAGSLHFLENLAISATMVWESYPVVWGALGLGLLTTIGTVVAARLLGRASRRPDPVPTLRWKGRLGAGFAALLLAGLGIYGNVILYPLRWSQAFFTDDAYLVALGLNPGLYFLDTLQVRDRGADPARVKAAAPVVARVLGVPTVDPARPDFARWVAPANPPGKRWNVVAVQLETQAAHWMGSAGNPLKATPHLDGIIAESIRFSNAYAPVYGTARSVWAVTTGIPDVSLVKTASRNPVIADQHTLFTAFTGYEPLYFLGGSANWANIRGFVKRSIPGLQLFEEGDYPGEQVIDVWGVSDLAVFKRAHAELSQRAAAGRPFVSLIQTSGNHRPYTIPDENAGFVRESPALETLVAAGFDSVDQYNAVRLIDHFVGVWRRWVEAGPYYRNTIFIFYGDHGTTCPKTASMGADFALNLTSLHVPMWIWVPGMQLTPRTIDTAASIPDVLPTAASLAGVPYLATALGQDLLDPALDPDRGVLTVNEEGNGQRLILVTRSRALRVDTDGSRTQLVSTVGKDSPLDVSAEEPQRCAELRTRALALYDCARYLLQHNPPRAHQGPATAPGAPSAAPLQ